MKNRILLMMLLLLMVLPFRAAEGSKAELDNNLGVTQECYDIFVKARKHIINKECLKDYERMLKLAKEKNDKDAICLAMSIPMLHYHYAGKEDDFLAALKRMKSTAEEYDLPYYVWWCFNEQISYYLETNHSLKALKIVNEQAKNVRGNIYAQFAINTAFGNIYMARRDEEHAREAFEKAEKIGLKSDKTLNLSYTYISLARITEAYDTLKRRDYLTKAYINSISAADSASALMGLAYLRSNQGKKQEFMQLYKKYKGTMLHETFTNKKYEKWYKSNEAYRMILEGKKDSAQIMLHSINEPYMRYQAQADFCRSTSDYKGATLYYDSLVNVLRSSQSQQNIADVAEINAIYEMDRLENERDAMRNRMTKSVMFTVIVFMVLIIMMLVVWGIRYRRSIRKLRALSHELVTARNEAEQASKMKDVFIQNMSHEIRTPLNAVTGFAQLLTLPAECLTDEKRQQFCTYIQNSTNLLTMLIDDILNISDIESGNYKMTIDSYGVNEIVTTAISTIKYRIPDNIQLTFESEVDDAYMIKTDARRAQQVLVNFLTNSIKHTDSGFIRVFVSLKENENFLSFIVEDSGDGVPADKAEAIFERFEKLNAFKQGTGLGLNICRVISDNLKGRCYLDTAYPESREDVEHGARFVFAIPLN